MKRQKKVSTLSTVVESLLSDSADIYLMFVDLNDSTLFKQTYISNGLSDNDWVFRQLIFLQKCAEFIKRYNGIVVKTMGDAVLAYFEATTDPQDILKCAIEIVQGFDNLSSYKGKSKIEVKISLDVGLTYNGAIDGSKYDPIGTPVDRCARLNSKAMRNEILVSEDFFDSLKANKAEDILTNQFGFVNRKDDLKGLGITNYYGFSAK